MESWEEGGIEVAAQTVTFGKVGDFIKGTFTGKKVVNTSNGETPLYELKADVGSYHNVDDKKNPIEPAVSVAKGSFYNVWGSFKSTSGANAITSLLNKSKLGDVVAVKLVEEIPSKTKGNAPFKKYKTMQFGPDKEYMGESSEMSAVSETLGVAPEDQVEGSPI